MLRKKTFYTPIVAANTLVAIEFDIPQEVGKIVGITVSGNREDLVYARGSSLELNISGTDIIKAGERSTQYMFGIDNPMRMWAFGELDLKNEDRKVRFRYQDTDSPIANFSAYQVEVILTYNVAV